MASKVRAPGLYEFLLEAELQQYYNGLKNILQVQNVGQLKYVVEEDLRNIGMSKPECRRLKTFFNKYTPGSYASKLRKFLGRKEEGREEALLGEDSAQCNRGAIKVPSQHVIQSDAISVYKELGQGEFGVVQQGVWTDDEGMRHQVAVKCLSKKRMQNNTLEFMKEYEIMQAIDHKHIVRLYGVILDAAQIMLITELAPLRSLLECLKEPSLRSTFTVHCLADFLLQICQGMMYLEGKRFIHRDLAARNILVFSKDTVKISDFGLSRALGVGKDYYQTNFNVNLKLPIAWCAPECINFLKFTSASDVWAFGVTMWELFSYGFQPWAALTGHQILEAIDEPGGQRLEQPVHCPREHYSIMEVCWRHSPGDRPSFAQVLAMLEEARPEQVQAVVGSGVTTGLPHYDASPTSGMLQYDVGDVITVLDRQGVAGSQNWSGVTTCGKVGWFTPSHTVSYLGNLPAAGWSQEPEAASQPSMFQRSTMMRRSKEERSSKRKISRDMISAPTGNVQHTGHVGPDGCYFGDVTFISGTNGHITMTAPPGGRLPSTGSENGFSSLSRADSDVSDSAPLLAPPVAEKPAAPLPRMGHAMGWVRKEEEVVAHQYQTISDEEAEPFGSPLDLGPSLMDEVFSELGDYDTLKVPKEEKKEDKGLINQLAGKVTTLTMSRTRHKGKKAAFVKPIKASDERTLENAIIMANQLASKSMHDLDKRVDDMFNASPDPITPNSPAKKFTFKFPSKHRPTSPKNSGRHFTDETSQSDLEWGVGAKSAYDALIGDPSSFGEKETTPPDKVDSGSSATTSRASSVAPASSSHRLSLPPTAFSKLSFSSSNTDPPEPILEQSSNPLPLPPKDRKSSVTSGKRHVRKNPLIMTSGAAASMARRFDETEPTCEPDQPSATNFNRSKDTQKEFSPTNDAFEEEIACSIDALDNIPESKYNSPKTSLESSEPPLTMGLVGRYNQDHVSCEDLLEFSPREDRRRKEKGGVESDEVRIMCKVLGGISADKTGCLMALNLTDWNVHRAIKLVKLKKALVQKTGIKDNEMKLALINSDWDVARAAEDFTNR